MQTVQLSKKKQYQTLAILVALLGVLISSIPFVLFFSPLLIVVFLLLKFTKLGEPVNKLYLYTYDWLFYRSDKPRKFLWAFMYDTMCTLYPQTKWSAMNYGYALLNGDGKTIKNLEQVHEEERFCLQLYHHVATRLQKVKSLRGLKVLEVGSGRGGGLNYVSTYLDAEFCVGVDYSQQQVDFCREAYSDNKNLMFYQGDSENLSLIQDLKDFDEVINVESSHCYGNFAKFAQEVYQVLKPGGYFIITDFREIGHLKQFEDDIRASGLTLVEKEDITVNVQHALKLDEKRKSQWIDTNAHRLLRPLFRKFSGLSDTRIYNDLKARRSVYVAQVWQKQ